MLLGKFTVLLIQGRHKVREQFDVPSENVSNRIAWTLGIK